MARYRYFTTDLLTGTLLAESLPLDVSKFTDKIQGAPGELDATLTLGLATGNRNQLSDNALMNATQAGRTALWVERDGQLEWGGVIWNTDWSSASPNLLAIKAQTYESLLDHLENRTTLAYVAQDQFFIMRDLLATAQGLGNTGFGIKVNEGETCGVLRDRTYNGWEQKKFGDLMRELSNVQNGFEWTLRVGYDEQGAPEVRLITSYPRLGAQTPDVFSYEYPGNIADYQWPETFASAANDIQELGSGDGAVVLSSVATDDQALTDGYPRLMASESFRDVSVQATLDDKAAAAIQAKSGSTILPKLTVNPDTWPVFGSVRSGDDIRVRLTSTRHPKNPDTNGPGFDGTLRVVGREFAPPNRSRADEQVSLIVAEVNRSPRVPVLLRDDITRWLFSEHDRRLRALEH